LLPLIVNHANFTHADALIRADISLVYGVPPGQKAF